MNRINQDILYVYESFFSLLIETMTFIEKKNERIHVHTENLAHKKKPPLPTRRDSNYAK